MANTRSASKRARQTTVRSLRNRSVLTRLRKMQKGISGTGAKPEAKDVQAMISAIDKAAKRSIIHKNAAKRRKARLNKSLATRPAGEVISET
jgi:small subunit ribosomal protein S20